MPTTFSDSVLLYFPAGTTVGAYPAASFAEGFDLTTAPPVAATASAAVAADGTLSLTGLTTNTDYWLGADLTPWKYIRASTRAATGTVTSVNGNAGAVTLTATDVSAQPVDSDLTSIAALTTTATGRSLLAAADAAAIRTIAGSAPLASPTFTGTPAAPTPTAGDSSTKVATTAFVAASGTSPMPGLVAPCDPRLVNALQAIGAQPWAMGSRVVVPKAGTLRDISIFVGVSSGNIRLAIYDTGDASAGNRTRLWDSGSVAAAGTNAWQVVADPALVVTAGQQLDFVLLADNGTVTAGKLPTIAANAVAQLPTSFWPAAGAAPPKLNWTANMGGFSFPTSFAEAAATAHQFTFFIMGRVA